jgi:hypothetical protein
MEVRKIVKSLENLPDWYYRKKRPYSHRRSQLKLQWVLK